MSYSNTRTMELCKLLRPRQSNLNSFLTNPTEKHTKIAEVILHGPVETK